MNERPIFNSNLTKKIYPSLEGRSIFLVESVGLVGLWSSACINDQGMRVEMAVEVPANLVDLMNDNGLESAIMHVNSFYELEPTIQAYKAGKKMVVTKSAIEFKGVLAEINRTIMLEGIPSLYKDAIWSLDRALEMIAEMFEKDSQK